MMKSPYFWAALVLLIAAVDLCSFGYLVFRSSGDPSFAVEDRYYEKGMEWDQRMAQERKDAELGWNAAVAPGAAEGGECLLRITVAARDGSAVAGARVSIETFANVRASVRCERAGVTDDAGLCAVRVPVTAPGIWEARVRAVGAAGDVFTQTIRFVMPPAEAGAS